MDIYILGTKYEIETLSKDKDPNLHDCDGYCDKTTKKIVIAELTEKDSDLGNIEAYMKKVLRHEIIHAFMFESGLGENWEHKHWGQEETTVDWFAFQGVKIYDAWKAAGAI